MARKRAKRDEPIPEANSAAKLDESRGKDEVEAGERIPLRRKLIYWAILVIALVGLSEGAGRIAYSSSFDAKQQALLQAFFGLATGYNPNMVSNYLPHHYLVYTLNPNTKVNYEAYYGSKPSHFINALGYRGKETTRDKPVGTFRVVCLGGSTTFGLGESEETMTYPAQLESQLNRIFESPKFEVINAGTPGWSSAESLINLLFRVSDLSPDAVVSYEGVNDTFAMRKDDEGGPDNGNFRRIVYYQMPGDFARFWLKWSHLWRLLYYWSYGKENIAFDINTLAVKPNPTKWLENLNAATGKYFRRNMANFVAVAKANEIMPVLVTMGHGPWHPSLSLTAQILRDIARDKGAVLIDFESLSRPGWFSGDNVHLERAGNTALAESVANGIASALDGRPGFVRRAH
jgi:lysophospholipase L1-like esterase